MLEPDQENPGAHSAEATLRTLLGDVLGIDAYRVSVFGAETPLFGALPELDSMAVATLLTEIEDRFGIVIDDDDVDGDTFETFGALTAFVEGKLAARRPS
jgi:acyl carrier protein